MTTIKCPKCNYDIELSDVLKKDIEASITADLDKKYSLEMKEKTEADTKEKAEMRQQIKDLIGQVRQSNRAKENAEIEAEKKLLGKEKLIREEAEKSAIEKKRLDLASKDKTISDLKKALEDAQRRASQGSQQLQGEILELDVERSFFEAFRDDKIVPVAKGARGGDICQIVKSPRGVVCGTILWETKNSKNWTEGWISKLKEDMRATKANISVIVTETLPKGVARDIGQHNGVWICKSNMAIILATLLRKGLLDAGYQKALSENRGGKAEALYNFVTSHEFVQQIEGMVETYKEMTEQTMKERAVFERLWSQREKQAKKLLLGTANIIGSMQGYIGQNSMPKIKGLDLLEDSKLDQLLIE
jgi:hypothetical protein